MRSESEESRANHVRPYGVPFKPIQMQSTKKADSSALSAFSSKSHWISDSGCSAVSGGTMSRISNQKVEPSPSLLFTP